MSLPDRSEAWEESLDPRLGSWYNPSSWGITKDIGKDFKDVATGNFGQLGKDVGNTISEGVKDVKGINKTVDNAAKSTWNFAKDHAGEIALGVGMGALALTGVGLIADAGIGAGLAADVAATAVADTAGAAVADTAGAAVADTAGAAAEDTAATAAEDTASSSGGRIQQLKDRVLNSAPAQKIKDISNTDAVRKVKNVVTNPAVDIAASTAYTQSNMPTTPEIQTPPAPPPAPTTYAAPPPVDTSSSATGAAVTGQDYTGTGPALNFSASKQDKILDLVEQFGLHPNDIKASLTSWQ